MFWLETWGFGHVVTIISLILAMVFVSFVLQAKRPPGSTMAWLLFILAIPYLGIPLYIILSQRKFTTRLGRKKSIYSSPKYGNFPWSQDDLENLLLSLGVPAPKRVENWSYISSGGSGLDSILETLNEAKKTIHLTTFIFAKDEAGNKILDLLVAKAKSGVKVRVLVDSFGSLLARSPSFKALIGAGGKVAYFMPFFHVPFRGRSNLRNHRKMFIVDSRLAIIGGMNIANDYLGTKNHWIDLALRFGGDAVCDLETVFAQDWEFATKEVLNPPENATPQLEGSPALQIIASGPDVKDDPLYDFLLSALYRAKKRIWIATPYFIPDESLLKALELAARREVDVQIWVPRKSNHFLADLARAGYLHELFEAKATIRLVKNMMHGKAVVIDDTYGLVGSANFDMRSLLLNFELGALVFHSEMLIPLENWFEHLPSEKLLEWPKQNYFAGLFEGIGRVVGPLI